MGLRKEWRTKKVWGDRPRICPCGAYGEVLHHIDRVPLNDVVENIQPLCRPCHLEEHRDEVLSDGNARVSKGWVTKTGRSKEETALLCKTATALVLVCGLTTRDAAERTGISKSYVHYLVKEERRKKGTT